MIKSYRSQLIKRSVFLLGILLFFFTQKQALSQGAGNCLDFDGIIDVDEEYVSLDYSSGLPIYNSSGGTYTVEFWVRGSTGQEDAVIYSETNFSDANPIFKISTGRATQSNSHLLAVLIRDNSSTFQINNIVSSGTVFDGTWHHIAWVDNNGVVSLYIDGLVDGGLSTTYARSTLTLDRSSISAVVRRDPDLGGVRNLFQGDVDELKRLHAARPDLVLAIGCSVFIGILCLSGGLAAWRMIRAKNLKLRLPVYLTLLVAGLIAVGLLVGQRVAQAEIEDDACADGMLLTSTAQAGNYLADLIPAGSLVYWNGYLSVAPLLSTPGIQIYPPQINNGYSYRLGGDAQELVRFGLWNDEMKKRWLEEADYITIETRRFSSEWAQILKPGQYQPLPPSPPVNPCKPNSAILVFKRINP